jgi:uncharacterized protein (DUF433 family)
MEPLHAQSEDVAWGATVIAGTRVPVDTLFDYLVRGKTLDEFLEEFPTVSREKAVAILNLARAHVSGRGALGNQDIGAAQARADRAQVRRLVAMTDMEREAFFLASNRNILQLLADARRSR